ncbi:ABC transporter G family member 31-like [Hibiscus syriacus]|uniref:ABC transporter G family member 31-like n=1 Tax=Hibiscus syriacus TaxID=106335 RepID=UPI0019243073|nr:ABC transporter G family member 31-like [Hibiscus syriacus]
MFQISITGNGTVGDNVLHAHGITTDEYLYWLGVVENEKSKSEAPSAEGSWKKRMILPFQPLAMTFQNVNYFVDMPKLLSNVSGVFRPGVLTALVGLIVAGKTTLLDVLSARKTGGYIEGDIKILGYPKEHKTFARISGYVKQNDIHSPQLTVEKSFCYKVFDEKNGGKAEAYPVDPAFTGI